ncbi:MAG: FG-GAP-like repeat-containing protein [Planctomycetota bacterium]|jgi:tetratricopeptide (TPR) repeat protein
MTNRTRNVRLCLALSLLTTACGGSETTSDETPPEVLVARERAAGLFAEERMTEALEAVQPLLDRKRVATEDLARAGILDLIVGSLLAVDDPAQVERGERRLQEVIERDPDNATAHYVLARRFYDLGEFERALPLIERAVELAPLDPPSQLLLSILYYEFGLDAADPSESADYWRRSEEILVEQIDRGPAFLGSWILPMLYRYSRLLLDMDRMEESNAVRDRRNELLARDITQPSNDDLIRGTLGRVLFPDPEGSVARPRPELVTADQDVVRWPAGLIDLEAVTLAPRHHAIAISDVDPNILPDQSYEGRLASRVQVDAHLSPSALVGHDGRALWSLSRGDEGWTETRWYASEAENGLEAWTAIDLGEERGTQEQFRGESEGRPYLLGEIQTVGSGESTTTRIRDGIEPYDVELVVAEGGRLLLLPGPGVEPLELARYEGRATDLRSVDIDHDGDLDLLLVGSFGLKLLRHDGAEGLLGAALGPDGEPGRFTDATSQFGLGSTPALDWIVTEDLDSDSDVDLLLGGREGALWLSSDRNERWTDRSRDLPSDLDTSRAPIAADFDGNGFADLWEPATGRMRIDRLGDGFDGDDTRVAHPPAGSAPLLVDVDLDGNPDVVWEESGELRGLLAPGLEGTAALVPLPLDQTGPVVIADLDRDGALDVAVPGRERTLRIEGQPALALGLKGIKDNPRGVGAIVHVRADDVYRRIHWRGEPLLVGSGGSELAEVVRVVWPNGVIQSELDNPTGSRRVLEQIEGLVGSCPFLYTWNGETFEFVTDVIGITPLGLPMAPGMLVPPDHDEYVLVTGEQLVPKANGELELQFTEELREVTYLDRAQLIAVDHPEGTEVFPNERFCFPPFPEPKTHVVEAVSPVLRALDDSGRDWAASLTATDGDIAEPFEAYRGQWLGLATPHTLELHFDPEAVADAEQLRLLMTGWLYWTDASVNVASARHPGYDFVPPILQVPDGEGGWKDAGPPVGFPAGKTKTMVLDVTDLIDAEDPRLRIFSTLRLFWDSIRLATDGDDTLHRETRLEPTVADLYERGFSRPIYLGGDARLEWFDWDQVESTPRWNQHPGMYTRFGDVRPLLGEIDDQFVIMGSGDALRMTFDGSQLPELPEGWRRDWLVFLDGWAKDRDPNTYSAEFVEPLPFHGMSAYPYPSEEHYPDDEEHRAYRREWNTRSAKRWIESLAGVR